MTPCKPLECIGNWFCPVQRPGWAWCIDGLLYLLYDCVFPIYFPSASRFNLIHYYKWGWRKKCFSEHSHFFLKGMCCLRFCLQHRGFFISVGLGIFHHCEHILARGFCQQLVPMICLPLLSLIEKFSSCFGVGVPLVRLSVCSPFSQLGVQVSSCWCYLLGPPWFLSWWNVVGKFVVVCYFRNTSSKYPGCHFYVCFAVVGDYFIPLLSGFLPFPLQVFLEVALCRLLPVVLLRGPFRNCFQLLWV